MVKHFSRRLISLLLGASMVATMLSGISLPAYADKTENIVDDTYVADGATWESYSDLIDLKDQSAMLAAFGQTKLF